ncbi:hypothetical protein J2744_001647 [Halorubrum trapanicum]|uniref:Uncharacterized protein n=1 Tax=Halorubrum trapanicum TaxID=29284 RepID=A0A8J7R818_9EURY|nr:hypothetical protein [Halorubrum trapanicum]MBP1901964.1 hypothetical protein [Halorubrum trapanicum]
MTGSDGERSGSRSDRASRFSDIASEFGDEFAGRSENGPDRRRDGESPDTGDDASGRTSDPDIDTDRWEWVGNDESGNAVGRDPPEPRASDITDRQKGGGRLWNDGPEDDESTDDGSVGNISTDGDPSRDDAGRTGTDAAGVGTEPSLDDRTDETSGRIWNEISATGESSTMTEATRSPSDGSVSAEPSPTATSEGLDASGFAEDESALDGRRLDPGTNVLVQSESRSERTRNGCHELLFGRESDRDPYVLLVRYQPMGGERLEDIASEGHRTHVISVGYAQSVPPAADGTVESTQINNPNDITRLGIVVSRITQGWSTDDREIRVCYDSLNVLLNYRDVKNAFRFLHVFLSTFTKTDAVAHFHADPLEGDPQAINTLKPLFDEVVSMDSTGTYVE